MIDCPKCKTQYDPRDGDCPSCGPIPHKPGLTPGILVPDYSQPWVKERVAAEADFMHYIQDPHGRRK